MAGLTWPQVAVHGSCLVAVAAIVTAVVARSRAAGRRGDAYQARVPVTYTRPPDGYQPPTTCEVCRGAIRLTPVIGGVMWLHTDLAAGRAHQVVMRPAGWWDTKTGGIVHGPAKVHNLAELIGEEDPR